MRATWNSTLSTGRSSPLSLPGLAWPVEIRPHPRARSLRLRVDEQRQLLTLTCPPRISRRAALDWVGRQAEWVDRQLAAIEPAVPLHPDAEILLEGHPTRLHWDASARRSPSLDGDRLTCGGPEPSFASRIERFLKARARDRLSAETARIAEACGVTVRSVSVGDAVSRWGSCSPDGAIRYNWRLILAPAHLLRWVVAHEVAHRVHMNHGPQFRALEATLYGADPATARAELRALGPRLKRIGRRV